MSRLVTVCVAIAVTISVEEPVMCSGESQVADFILPALDELKEASADVKLITYAFVEN